MRKIEFDKIETEVSERPGIYEIYTNSGIPLKVGIGQDLKKRLLQHRVSKESALKLKAGGCFNNPSDVLSKQSILAKHLYYDRSIAPAFNLRKEAGRRIFLCSQCYIVFEYAESREKARQLEALRERQVSWRYRGRVKKR